MNAYETRHKTVRGTPYASTDAGLYGSAECVGEILESKDLLNYFKKLERAFRRDVGNKDEEEPGKRNTVEIAVESASSLVATAPRQNCSVEHPRLFQKCSRRHPRKIKAEPSNVRPTTAFRIREGWSEGDIEHLRKTDSSYHRPGTYREGSSLPLFATETFTSVTGGRADRTESRDPVAFRLILDRGNRIPIADRFSRVFPIVDDLNSSEILRCERLLSDERKRERDREDGNFRFMERKGAERTYLFPGNDVGTKGFRGTCARTRNRVNARDDHRHEEEPRQRLKEEAAEKKEKLALCQLVNTRRDGRRERSDDLRETDIELLKHSIDEYPCPCIDTIRARPRNRNGNNRIGGGASLTTRILPEKDRCIINGGCDFSKETMPRRATWNIDWRKQGHNIRKARKTWDDRISSLKTSRAKSCGQATCSEHARSTLHRFDSCCHVENVRGTVTNESDATCCSCGSRRAAFHLDANDSAGQLEAVTRRRRKCASVRSTTTVTPSRALPSRPRLFESRSHRRTATGRNEHRRSNCCESFDVPIETIVSGKRNKMIGHSFDGSHRRVAKPEDSIGKVHLKKVLVYPPRGQEGPPLTLYKSSSDIDCVVKGNPRVGFRYDVTYVQKFQSSTWCPDKNSCH